MGSWWKVCLMAMNWICSVPILKWPWWSNHKISFICEFYHLIMG
jgi:hypothetical protein